MPLSQILCNADNPSDCDFMNGLFNYVNDRYGFVFGECGAIKGVPGCARGDNYVSSDYLPYHAYCARQV